jgi:uncharacterized RDD family membrane protein YckC
MCAYANGTTATSLTKLLTDAAQPNLYQINAFRLLELQAECNLAEAGKRQKMLEIAAKTGAPTPPGSGRAFPLANPPDTFGITAAIQRLQDPFSRLIDEFFWFWPSLPGNGSNDVALQALRNGDMQSAVDQWGVQPLSDSAAVHNLAVLYHIMAMDLETIGTERTLSDVEINNLNVFWRQSFRRWSALINSDSFWRRLEDRIRSYGDTRLRPEAVSDLRKGTTQMLLMINARLATGAADRGDYATTQRHTRIMNDSGFEKTAIINVLTEAVDSLRDRLKTYVTTAKKESDQDPLHANRSVERLINLATPVLSSIDQLLPVDAAAREASHDEVALGALECLIPYGNKTEDWKGALLLTNRIRPLVMSTSGRQRMEESIKTLEENAKSGNDWCGSGYFELPAEYLTPLEQAHDLARQRNWDGALRILNDLAARPVTAGQRRLINKPIAFCMNMRCNEQLKVALDEMTTTPTVILNIMRRVENKDWRFTTTASALAINDEQGAARRGQLYCMDCGSAVMEWVTFTYKDLRFLVCRNCSGRDDNERSQRKQHFSTKLTSIATDMLKARDLDPENATVVENIGELRKIATDLSVSIPGLTTSGTPARQPAYTPPPPPRASTPAAPRTTNPATRTAPAARSTGYGQAVSSLARLGAFFIDSIFVLIAMGAIIGFGKTGNDSATISWVFAAGMFGYYTLCYVLTKRTFGEAAIKARLVTRSGDQWNAGKAFFRTLIFTALCTASFLIPGASIILFLALIAIILFTKDHRSLADMLAGTWLMKV